MGFSFVSGIGPVGFLDLKPNLQRLRASGTKTLYSIALTRILLSPPQPFLMPSSRCSVVLLVEGTLNTWAKWLGRR